ncbi:MAG TPA: DUF2911 domain-containing protein [Thermoanaerobaculia bacterium]|jgi:hypothetical protein|nr:DUF2911 domain-containing protein [Thermoanaerobaculia bacterium]
MKRTALGALALSILAFSAIAANAQAPAPQLFAPRPSPGAVVTQTIGLTDVTIRYSRPGVKGRKIWGELVPYGEVWRTGANENTTITFSTAVKVEGKELPAGTYGLQTIPTEKEWTLILSKDADDWGAFDYKPEHDAMRATVTPASHDHVKERMEFYFDDLTDTSATVKLMWEKLTVPFKIEVDTVGQVAAKQRWQALYQGANWCVDNGCVDNAEKWLDASVSLDANFYNLRSAANLYAKKGQTKEAVAAGERALAAAKTATPPPAPDQVAALEKLVAEWKAKK